MKKRNGKMIPVCVYCDTSGLFSPAECDEDNTIELDFPLWIVKEYYNLYKDDFKAGMECELRTRGSFKKWYDSYYTADDTIELFDYAYIKGFVPALNSDMKMYLFYLDNDDNEIVVFRGSEDECRRYGKVYDWTYEGHELAIEYDDIIDND